MGFDWAYPVVPNATLWQSTLTASGDVTLAGRVAYFSDCGCALSTKDGKPRRGHPASPKDIEWMKQQVSLPVVIKGMMSAEDTRTAVNAGADAVLVSNHGGRILDFNRAALEALPEVVDAVGAKVPVWRPWSPVFRVGGARRAAGAGAAAGAVAVVLGSDTLPAASSARTA